MRQVIMAISVLVAIVASVGRAGDWSAVLVSPDEPGEPLLVSGNVYAPDGETPAQGVTLFVYQTDASGYYSATNDRTNPRLKATITTDASGRYQFRTVKPAPYPGGGVPAHVHFVVRGGGYPEQRRELRFEGDPHLSERLADRSRAAGRFGSIRPLTRDSHGGLRCTFDIRLDR